MTQKGAVSEQRSAWSIGKLTTGETIVLASDGTELTIGGTSPFGAVRELRWGLIADQSSAALVSWCGNHVKSGEKRPRIGKERASKTPAAFRDELLGLARSVYDVGRRVA